MQKQTQHKQGQRRHVDQKTLKKRKAKKRRLKFLLTIEILVVIGAVIFGVYYFFFSKLQSDNLDKKNIHVNDFNDENIDDYRNIVLYGLDSQDNKFGKGNRSDSIIIASINKKTEDIKLLSVYRDTYVSVEGHDLTKINHSYSYGGPELAINTLNRNFDLDVTNYVTVNFSALAQTIDLLGGIELDIRSEELKNLNDYIGNMNKINGGNSPKLTSAGKQTLDGNQAVAYSRIRYTAGGDLRRAERQRTVIEQILVKAKKSNPVTLVKVANQMLPQIKTSLNSTDVLVLAKDILSYEITDNAGFPFDNRGQKINGTYYGVPITLESNVQKMHSFLFGTENYQVSDTVKEISNKISGQAR